MMSAREDRRLLKVSIVFIVGLLAIGIIVANIRHLDLGQGSQGLGPEIREITMALMYALAIIWVAIFAYNLLKKRTRMKGKESNEPRKNSLVVTLILIGALILAILAVDQVQGIADGPTDPGTGPTPDEGGENPVINDGTGWTSALFVILGVLVIAFAFVAMKHDRSTPLRRHRAQLVLDQKATEAIHQARMDLFAGEDPRSVIVRTYQQMSRILGQGGRDLKPLTPREVAEMAERNLGWPKAPLTELTSLYEEAWYSRHPMGDAERDRALRAFEALASKGNGREAGLERTAA